MNYQQDIFDDEYDQFDTDELQCVQDVDIFSQGFSKMTHDSLITYWCAQSAAMRGALLAFWRNAATSPNASSTLFAGVVAALQRISIRNPYRVKH